MTTVASTTVDVNVSGNATSNGVAVEHLHQSSVEVHHASSPDQHATGSALPVDASGPHATQSAGSCSIVDFCCLSPPQHITA